MNLGRRAVFPHADQVAAPRKRPGRPSTTPSGDKEYLTLGQAAAFLAVSERTVARWIKDRDRSGIPALRITGPTATSKAMVRLEKGKLAAWYERAFSL